MKNPSIIIGRNAGETVDEEFVDQIGKELPNVSLLFIDGDSGEITKITGVTVTDYKETVSDPDTTQAVYACFSKDSESDEYGQPTIILDDNNKPVCGIFIEGDVKDAPPTSSKPDTYHITTDYLVGKIADVRQDVEEDIGKLAKKFNQMFTQKEVLSNVSPGDSGRCSIFILFANGETAHLSKGSLQRTFEWGWASRGLDNADKPVLSVVTDKKPSALDRLKAKQNGGASPAAIGTAAPVAAKTSVPVVGTTTNMIIPSKGRCTTNDSLGKWYDQFSEVGRPSGWEQGVGNWHAAIPVPAKEGILKKYYENNQVQKFDPKVHVRVSPDAASPVATGTGGAQPSDDYAVLLTPKTERDKLVEVHKKIKTLDDTSKLILPSDRVQAALGDKFPDPFQEIGLKGIEDLYGLSEDGFYEYASKSPRWMARLAARLVLNHMIANKAVKTLGQGKVAM